jgi:ABC-type antimicrobial peptide transport system permease subunit
VKNLKEGNIYLKSGEGILVVSYVFITIVFMTILFNLYNNIELSKIARGYLSDKYIEIELLSKLDEKNWSDLLKSVMPENSYLYRYDSSNEENVIGIYRREKFKNPPLKEGRFLDEDECLKNNKIAVVGQGLQHRIIKNNNKEYIVINGDYYEVIGIMGASYKSRLDGMIFIPIKVLEGYTGISGEIIIDGIKSTNKIIDDMINFSKDSLEVKVIPKADSDIRMISPLSGEIISDKNSKDSEQVSLVKLYVYIIVIISAILCIINATRYWLEKRNEEIKVYSIIGFYKYEVFKRCISRYLMSSMTGIVMGFFVGLILFKFYY